MISDQNIKDRDLATTLLSGLGDDDANLEDDFITWKEKFWTSACEKLKLEIVGDDFSTRQYEIKARLPYSSLSLNLSLANGIETIFEALLPKP